MGKFNLRILKDEYCKDFPAFGEQGSFFVFFLKQLYDIWPPDGPVVPTTYQELVLHSLGHRYRERVKQEAEEQAAEKKNTTNAPGGKKDIFRPYCLKDPERKTVFPPYLIKVGNVPHRLL